MAKSGDFQGDHVIDLGQVIWEARELKFKDDRAFGQEGGEFRAGH